ncbi:ComF family protein [Parvibium lacunae]|uniref:ComF family protein n=1 Tax=Parvibium lacunae TaxID=1888893 RepID=A0A368KZ68_9BURK|nr:ComF family protein [Parvibium lacunae]RCS56666.1 ComF family protein [Parvibium lacunae]
MACANLLPQQPNRCPVCASPSAAGARPNSPCVRCSQHPPAFHRTYAGVAYEAPFDRLLHALKFQGHLAGAPFFARAILNRLIADNDSEHGATIQALQTTAALVPIPLSQQGLARRGFNQAYVLAKALHQYASSRGIALPPIQSNWLVRQQDLPPQSSLNRQARLQNLRHAFNVPAIHQPLLFGQSIILIDDVMTSGMTLHFAAKALQAAGALHIYGLVAARTALQA